MTSHDLPAFRELFDNLRFSGLSFTPPKDRTDQALATYFQALEPYPFHAVKQAYDTLQHGLTKWPAVSQWVQALPKHGLGMGEMGMMDWRQAKEWTEAERLFYEGDPCGCADCILANVTYLPTRYVPCLDANGDTIPMRHPNKPLPVLRGEWLHGFPLKRWYSARAEFYQKLETLKPGMKRELETTR